jgi:hypothetical protein
MENTILNPVQINLADEVNRLQLLTLTLEREIILLKTQIADKNIAILKASLLFEEVLEQYNN